RLLQLLAPAHLARFTAAEVLVHPRVRAVVYVPADLRAEQRVERQPLPRQAAAQPEVQVGIAVADPDDGRVAGLVVLQDREAPAVRRAVEGCGCAPLVVPPVTALADPDEPAVVVAPELVE